MSNVSAREIRESPWEQGADEARDYVLDTSPWGGSPANPVVSLFDGAGEDVTEAHVTGETTVNGDTLVTGVIADLVAGEEYRLEFLFEHHGRTEEAWGRIICTR